MPLADAFNKYKDDWIAKLATAKGPHLGRSLVVEVPVDATSKIGVPMPMLLLHTLSGGSVTNEPANVRELTIWRPPVSNTSTPNANRRNILRGTRVRAYKKAEYTRFFVEAPVTPGYWRKYTQTRVGEKILRFISIKAPPIVSVSGLLYVFAHYFTIKPASLRTYNSMFRIPSSDGLALANLGELTVGRSEAPNQVQGELFADAPVSSEGNKSVKK
ncbi:hypothetical protein AB3M80_11370 [Arthrospira platensis BEA 1257B]